VGALREGKKRLFTKEDVNKQIFKYYLYFKLLHEDEELQNSRDF